MKISTDVAIVGAGFAGIGMAIELERAGISDYTIVERAGDVGGIWRDNAYPGCACDIPSMLYSFSFAPAAHAWTRHFPGRDEIWEYLRRLARENGILQRIRFDWDMRDASYDETACRWQLRSSAGDELDARVVVLATGALNRPQLPSFPGLERFEGPSVHSSQWNPEFDVRGRDVAVVGTGASAIQIVPEIAPLARRLTVYQRSPAWIMPRADRPVSPALRAARRWIPGFAWAERQSIYWSLEARAYGFVQNTRALQFGERLALAHLKKQVTDPELARKLTPSYRMGCKRVLLSDDFYPALCAPNVELVTGAIARFEPHGIVAEDGTLRPADAVIFATGFTATQPLGDVSVRGAGGRELRDVWKDGMEAFLGSSIAGFPNLFTIVGPNTGLGHNSMIVIMEAQYRYVLDALALLRRRGARAIDVDREIQDAFNRDLSQRLGRTVWNSGCASWYLDANGRNTTLWPGYTFAYRAATKRVREERYRLTK